MPQGHRGESDSTTAHGFREHQPRSLTDRAKQLVMDVLTNNDRFSDTELIAQLRKFVQDGVTQAEIVQFIEDFPPEKMSFNGKEWFLEIVRNMWV